MNRFRKFDKTIGSAQYKKKHNTTLCMRIQPNKLIPKWKIVGKKEQTFHGKSWMGRDAWNFVLFLFFVLHYRQKKMFFNFQSSQNLQIQFSALLTLLVVHSSIRR